MRMDNICNEGTHGSLHQLGDRLRKSLRAVGVKSGDDRVEYTDIGGDVRLGGQRAFEPSISVRRGDGTDFGKPAFSPVERSPASSLATAREKIYAVAVGRQIGIIDKWATAKAAVEGVPKAVYRGFATSVEAKELMRL